MVKRLHTSKMAARITAWNMVSVRLPTCRYEQFIQLQRHMHSDRARTAPLPPPCCAQHVRCNGVQLDD